MTELQEIAICLREVERQIGLMQAEVQQLRCLWLADIEMESP